MASVTIVIPTFNQMPYLPACVDRCLFQTHPDLEIVIVDGGSTDGTKAYLAGLPARIASATASPVARMQEDGDIVREEILTCPQGRRLTIVACDRDIGPTRTYNEGFARATGEFCTYVPGDDLPYPHMVEELATALIETGADFAYADQDVVEDDGRVFRRMTFPDFDFKACLADWFHLGVCKLYRTRLHRTVGLMDEAYQSANDYDHYLRFAMAGAKFVHVPRVLYGVRRHGPNRPTGQHAPARYERLLEESRQCARRARDFLQSRKPTGNPAP
ncbi:glycosyl transferase family 2 [Solidesulfovibrio carbinoliphilus subsp. oakridgensis]|uniref:Glycosyl transferase family 2 n=1 Tax=Solidesulfovibrio carbinoliphilus subsp. oakridgensis TaxID=694327 RepID=G7QCR1_9BACT|nr:glycosyltransferase [Solidesulfovibrio carbinoliphilus]EHJ46217.1 glycosyl transferase family 2 [Solidesulfovibrio carbinoliphilus subsp. oakridgensis]